MCIVHGYVRQHVISSEYQAGPASELHDAFPSAHSKTFECNRLISIRNRRKCSDCIWFLCLEGERISEVHSQQGEGIRVTGKAVGLLVVRVGLCKQSFLTR